MPFHAQRNGTLDKSDSVATKGHSHAPTRPPPKIIGGSRLSQLRTLRDVEDQDSLHGVTWIDGVQERVAVRFGVDLGLGVVLVPHVPVTVGPLGSICRRSAAPCRCSLPSR